jgi:hypothetical protein
MDYCPDTALSSHPDRPISHLVANAPILGQLLSLNAFAPFNFLDAAELDMRYIHIGLKLRQESRVFIYW